MKRGKNLLYLGIAASLLMIIAFVASPATSLALGSVQQANKTPNLEIKSSSSVPRVFIDVGHRNEHRNDLETFAGTATEWDCKLTEWGYNVTLSSGGFNASMLQGVDIFIATSPYGGEAGLGVEYTQAEKDALKAWFNSGGKGVWVAANSDFADVKGNTAKYTNELLKAINSTVLVESASVESQANFGEAYRVSATTYNTNDPIPTAINKDNQYQMALFHGPSPLIGVNSSGGYESLERYTTSLNKYSGIRSYYASQGVYWVARSVNNATHYSIIVKQSGPGLTYDTHIDNAKGSFILMTVQEKTLPSGNTSKIVVTSEAIFSDYKEMIHQPGEHGIYHNDPFIVNNTMEWLAPRVSHNKPVAHISYPTDGSTVTFIQGQAMSINVKFEGVVYGGWSTVNNYEVTYGGSPTNVTTTSVQWNFTAEGSYTFEVVPYTANGIKGDAVTSTFTVEIVIPTVPTTPTALTNTTTGTGTGPTSAAPTDTTTTTSGPPAGDGVPGFGMLVVIPALGLVSFCISVRRRRT